MEARAWAKVSCDRVRSCRARTSPLRCQCAIAPASKVTTPNAPATPSKARRLRCQGASAASMGALAVTITLWYSEGRTATNASSPVIRSGPRCTLPDAPPTPNHGRIRPVTASFGGTLTRSWPVSSSKVARKPARSVACAVIVASKARGVTDTSTTCWPLCSWTSLAATMPRSLSKVSITGA